MTTSVLAATLPRFIVIKSKPYSDKGNAYFKADGAYVLVGEDDVFSTLVKIEVERATINDKYVNLRFGYFNRYWHRNGNDNFIVAESDQPQEDTTKSSCTLFEPVKVDDNGVFYLSHVQSGGRLSVDGPTMAFYVDENPGDDEKGYLTFVDWNTLVKLPAHVAFKGDNGKYLDIVIMILSFDNDDQNYESSGWIVELMPDGHVQIRQAVGEVIYWSVSLEDSWVGFIKPLNERNKFWPVKIDENSIALRSADTNNFCCRLSSGGLQDALSASATTITKEAIMEVQELVLGRKIYNVIYQMEYARIFNEAPYLAGSASLENNQDEEASMEASVTYTDEKSYTFSRSLSLTAGVSSTIEGGLPFIEKASITVNYEINGTFQWENTTTTTTSITATGTVPVPGKSKATVDYVGTRGTCNVPYSYTQEDRSSTDGQIVYTDLVDGIYTGVNYYNFSFVVRETEPL